MPIRVLQLYFIQAVVHFIANNVALLPCRIDYDCIDVIRGLLLDCREVVLLIAKVRMLVDDRVVLPDVALDSRILVNEV